MVILREEDASSSSSGGKYDVFLSFRYEDIGKKFADHLHWRLDFCGFRIFRPNEDMERGENIMPELQKAIKESRISIIIFSKGYASSSWCLDELVMILQHKRTSSGGHHVLPIFYDVDQSHVRNQMGSFKKAFESYEEGERKDGWKVALREAADFAGMNLQNEANGHEAKFIQKIEEVVRERLRHIILSMPIYPIGIESQAKFILSWLNGGSRDASMLAICGMGGLGKTTIAKYIYNHNWSKFQGSSFLANIAEASKQPKGLSGLQTQLLLDIVKERGVVVNNVDEGIVKMKLHTGWQLHNRWYATSGITCT